MRVIAIIVVANLSWGCVSPGAVQAKLGVLESQLEKLTEQSAGTQILADRIDKIENQTHQTTQVLGTLLDWKQSIRADTIRYGGAGWVVLGGGVIVALFLGAGVLLLWVFIRRAKTSDNLLKLVTCAVKNTPARVQARVKKQVETEVANGGPFGPKDKTALAQFVRASGTFADTDTGPRLHVGGGAHANV